MLSFRLITRGIPLTAAAVGIVGVGYNIAGYYNGPAFQRAPVVLVQNKPTEAPATPAAPAAGSAPQNTQTNSNYNTQTNSNYQNGCNVSVTGSVHGSVTNGPCPASGR